MKFLSKTRWIVLNCLTGDWKIVERVPFSIGSDPWSDFRLDGSAVFARHCEITHSREQGYFIAKSDPEGRMAVNGMDVDFAPLKPLEDYSLAVGQHLLLIRGDNDLSRWQNRLQLDAWTLHDPQGAPMDSAPHPLLDICQRALVESLDPLCIVVPGGAGMGFPLNHVLEIYAPLLDSGSGSPTLTRPPLQPDLTSPPLSSFPPPTAGQTLPHPTVDDSPGVGSLLGSDVLRITGRHQCPVCLLRFGDEHVMHVATHASIRGVVFHATRFNDQHQALDACGSPCTEIVCPHCEKTLFPQFLHLKQHILSIVGDQSAGKSYYLSVLVRILATRLFRQFSSNFQDGDPAGNAMLTDLVKALFSAQTPEEALIPKTVLEGAMYVEIRRFGSLVKMPRPFVFSLESIDSNHAATDPSSRLEPARKCALVFYDNAGEHFQAGRDSIESPGAQHIASADGIFFLFDPFNNPEFRRQMTHAGLSDPQLERPISDQQEIILSEMRSRLIKLLNLKPGQKIDTPLAVLVGKCDAWLPLIQHRPFLPISDAPRLDIETLHANSARLREFMVELAPRIVANAESISNRVAYFPISSFGHTPVSAGQGHWAPDPRRLDPLMVDLPPLWIFSQIEPNIVPT